MPDAQSAIARMVAPRLRARELALPWARSETCGLMDRVLA